MAIKTRLTQAGWGGRPYAGFTIKVGFNRLTITRLTQTAWGGRPYLGFVAKSAAAGGPPKHEGLLPNVGKFLR